MQPSRSLLTKLASRYVWWKSPEEALAMPARVVAQTMNIGSYEDIQQLALEADDDYLREIVSCAEIGQFNERSWSYWHYRLGLATPEAVSPNAEAQFGMIGRFETRFSILPPAQRRLWPALATARSSAIR